MLYSFVIFYCVKLELTYCDLIGLKTQGAIQGVVLPILHPTPLRFPWVSENLNLGLQSSSASFYHYGTLNNLYSFRPVYGIHHLKCHSTYVHCSRKFWGQNNRPDRGQWPFNLSVISCRVGKRCDI